MRTFDCIGGGITLGLTEWHNISPISLALCCWRSRAGWVENGSRKNLIILEEVLDAAWGPLRARDFAYDSDPMYLNKSHMRSRRRTEEKNSIWKCMFPTSIRMYRTSCLVGPFSKRLLCWKPNHIDRFHGWVTQVIKFVLMKPYYYYDTHTYSDFQRKFGREYGYSLPEKNFRMSWKGSPIFFRTRPEKLRRRDLTNWHL